MIYDFKTQLALGKMVEEELDKYFSAIFQIATVTLADEIAKGYDRIFTQGERSITVEYKADFKSHSTGNAYVELEVISDNRQKGGWAKHSIADVIVYAVVDGEGSIISLYNIDREKLQSSLSEWEEKFRRVECQNKGWKSTGLLVPLKELKTVCKSTKGVR